MKQVRKIIYFKQYFKDFYDQQSNKVAEKIDLGIYYLQYTQQMPSRYVGSTKKPNLHYLRIKQGSDIYRIFFCYDKGKVVVLMNGFTKKTQKTPKSEIDRALKIKTITSMKKKSNISTFEDHLTEQYGAIGTIERTAFEVKAKAFVIGELLKDERLQAKLTQEELADKIGAKKSYISRIETGKTDIQLSTLYKLFEVGLGKQITISIN